MNIRIHIKVKISRIIKFFVLSDLLLVAGWGLAEPIFSIFVINQVRGATLVTVGVAVAIYWILRSVLLIPIARVLDKIRGERDDFYALIAGLCIAAATAVWFVFVREVWQLYLAQALHAIGFALYVTAWSGMFSRHLDGDRVSFEWAIENTALSVAAGVSGLLGGIIASRFGFSVVFISVAALSLIAAVTLIAAPEIVFPKKGTQEVSVKIEKSH